ncbi:hypothetical protein CJ483_00265 [Bacillus sp. PK3_68]|nr:hypothetical protein CJ483_00265 [Bacillus sp. PK3_68]
MIQRGGNWLLKRRKNRWIRRLPSPDKWLSTEQIRMMKMNIQHAVKHENLVLMVTSPEENRRQPFISSKLASSFAEAGKKVLLVDVNFRKPVIHQLFGFRNASGLSNLLRGEKGKVMEGIVQNLDILSAGSFSIHLESLERIEQLITVWQRCYDVIVLDTPAFLDAADSQILSSACDGVLLVIQENRTKEANALQVKKILERTNNNLLGAIYQTS